MSPTALTQRQEGDILEAGAREVLGLPPWRLLARRAALRRAYFRLRAAGDGRRRAMRLVRRLGRALRARARRMPDPPSAVGDIVTTAVGFALDVP